MPTTPATWLAPITVNTETSAGQSDPDIIQLANGNVLIIWTSASDAGVAGSGDGLDIVGQIFDPFGNRVGAEFRVNQGFFADSEENGDIVALPDGGFMMVYHDNEFGSGGGQPLRFSRYDAAGVSTANGTIVADAAAGDPNFFNPRIAVSSATSALVVYQQFTGGQTTTVGAIFDPSTNTFGAQFSILAANGENNADPDVTVLTNGNYVVTANLGGADPSVYFRIISPAGANVLAFTEVANTNGDTVNDREATVTALSGGGFVIAWTNTDVNDTDVLYRTYNAAGVETGSGQLPGLGATELRNEPTIAALADGSFVIIVDDDELDQMVVQHFSATGSLLGSEFVPTTESVTELSAIGLADGRLQISYTQVGGEIRTVILDTSDVGNTTGSYFYGTVGNDTITGSATNVGGGAGNDIITEGSANYIDGGDGDDTIILTSVISSGEVWRGGAGIDTLDLSLDPDNLLTVDLEAGTLVYSNFGSGDTLSGLENVLGTSFADTIRGSSVANTLYGQGGNDIVEGRGGNDTLFGGDGVDVLDGGDGNDTLVGNAQIFVQQQDTLTGGIGNDTIYAENVDVINGGTGLDSLIAINAFNFTLDMNATSIEYAILDFGNDVVTAASQSVRVDVFASGGNDQITGSNFDDALFGGSGNDIIIGGQGADAIVGEAGADSLNGGDGNDRIYFDALDTFVSGGAGFDAGYITGSGTGATVDMGASQLEFLQDLAGLGDTVFGASMSTGMQAYMGGGNDTVNGSNFADTVFGDSGSDTLNGNDGNDVLVGGTGTDILRGGLGNDALYGGTADGVRDDFAFNAAGASHADAVYDFVVGTDKIDLSAFAGNTFASVSITTSGGSSIVRLNGQVICTVVGTVGLGIGDFIMAGAAPSDPGDTPIVKGDIAQTLPGLDDFVDAPLVQPTTPDDAVTGPADFALASVSADFGFDMGRPGGHQAEGWFTVLV